MGQVNACYFLDRDRNSNTICWKYGSTSSSDPSFCICSMWACKPDSYTSSVSDIFYRKLPYCRHQRSNVHACGCFRNWQCQYWASTLTLCQTQLWAPPAPTLDQEPTLSGSAGARRGFALRSRQQLLFTKLFFFFFFLLLWWWEWVYGITAVLLQLQMSCCLPSGPAQPCVWSRPHSILLRHSWGDRRSCWFRSTSPAQLILFLPVEITTSSALPAEARVGTP